VKELLLRLFQYFTGGTKRALIYVFIHIFVTVQWYVSLTPLLTD